MRSVAGCWIFGFFHDVLEDEILRRRWSVGASPHAPRALLGVPPVDGEEQLAAELDQLETVERAVFFEGFAFERAARRAGRIQLIEAMAARGIPTVWLSAAEVPGALVRTTSVENVLRQVAAAMCDLALPDASCPKDPTRWYKAECARAQCRLGAMVTARQVATVRLTPKPRDVGVTSFGVLVGRRKRLAC